MKKLIALTLMALLLIACKNPVTEKIKETKEQVSNTKNAVKEANKMQDDLKRLQEETPLTNDEMKAWLPDEIMGMKRTGYKAGQAAFIQIAQVEATYQNEDKSKKLVVQVIDGAGEMGAAATAGFRIVFSQDFEEEDEYKMRRTNKRDGIKVIEEYRKNSNRSDIQFMESDRFYFNAKGTNMDLDEVWDAVQEMDPEALG